MSDSKENEQKKSQAEDSLMSDTEFRLGYDNEQNPKIMVINVPIQWCTDNPENGTAFLRGKLDEAKQIALKIIQAKRMKAAQQKGILKPSEADLQVVQ